MLPFKRKSRLLAPTENVNFPAGFRQPCATASHTLKSYRESVRITVSLWCGLRSTSENPRRTLGGSPALDGKWRYSCGIYGQGEAGVSGTNLCLRIPREKERRRNAPRHP